MQARTAASPAPVARPMAATAAAAAATTVTASSGASPLPDLSPASVVSLVSGWVSQHLQPLATAAATAAVAAASSPPSSSSPTHTATTTTTTTTSSPPHPAPRVTVARPDGVVHRRDGIFRVTRRILVMKNPGASAQSEPRHVTIDSLAHALRRAFAPGTFMVWNLSEQQYDYGKFDNQVVECRFPGYPCAPLSQAFSIAKAMWSWLCADASNVVLVHCQDGHGRTIVALFYLLLWSNLARTLPDALHIINQAYGDGDVTRVLIPTQLRYVSYLETLARDLCPPSYSLPSSSSPSSSLPSSSTNTSSVLLERIIMHGIPRCEVALAHEGGDSSNPPGNATATAAGLCRPYLQMFQHSNLIYTSTGRDSRSLRWYTADDANVLFPVDLVLTSDVLVRVRHLTLTGHRTSLFRFCFHPCFVPDGNLRLTASELDGVATQRHRFPSDFLVDLVFRRLPNTARHASSTTGPTAAAATSASDAAHPSGSAATPSTTSDDGELLTRQWSERVRLDDADRADMLLQPSSSAAASAATVSSSSQSTESSSSIHATPSATTRTSTASLTTPPAVTSSPHSTSPPRSDDHSVARTSTTSDALATISTTANRLLFSLFGDSEGAPPRPASTSPMPDAATGDRRVLSSREAEPVATQSSAPSSSSSSSSKETRPTADVSHTSSARASVSDSSADGTDDFAELQQYVSGLSAFSVPDDIASDSDDSVSVSSDATRTNNSQAASSSSMSTSSALTTHHREQAEAAPRQRVEPAAAQNDDDDDEDDAGLVADVELTDVDEALILQALQDELLMDEGVDGAKTAASSDRLRSSLSSLDESKDDIAAELDLSLRSDVSLDGEIP